MRKPRGADLGTDTMLAATSAAMTLWHRLPMFGLASMATLAQRQAEGVRMMDEKAAAFIEGTIAANMEVVRVLSAAAMGQFGPLMNAPAAIADAGLRPAFRRVSANAKRLNRRAIRNTFGS